MSPETYSEPSWTAAVEFILEKFADLGRWPLRKNIHPGYLVDLWLHILNQSWCPFIIYIITYFPYLDPR